MRRCSLSLTVFFALGLFHHVCAQEAPYFKFDVPVDFQRLPTKTAAVKIGCSVYKDSTQVGSGDFDITTFDENRSFRGRVQVPITWTRPAVHPSEATHWDCNASSLSRDGFLFAFWTLSDPTSSLFDADYRGGPETVLDVAASGRF